MKYFTSEKLSERMIRITDITNVCCYLILGDNKACLIDSCNGIGNIREYISRLTELPVIVVLSHGHADHIGGASLFEDVYLNSKDEEVFKQHNDYEFKVENAKRFMEQCKEITFNEAVLVPSLQKAYHLLSDGQTFELGGVTIKMVSVPGHTQGMMCALIVEERAIIFGDACGTAVMLVDEFATSVEEYRNSLKKLKQLETAYDTIYRNHGVFTSSKELLDNVLECCDLILAGKDAHEMSVMMEKTIFSAKRISNVTHMREDGKEGNIFYGSGKIKGQRIWNM